MSENKVHPVIYDPHGKLPLKDRKRRLLFRAWHRGIKELDLIMGNFVEVNIDSFTEHDCAWFEHLFEQKDHDILSWVTTNAAPPDDFDNSMMQRLKKLDFMKLKAR